jgi:hypothetical protein
LPTEHSATPIPAGRVAKAVMHRSLPLFIGASSAYISAVVFGDYGNKRAV